jgi:DnaB-helicase binding domain of primase
VGKIVDISEWRNRVRDQLTVEILHHDKHPEDDVETDRMYASLNRLYDDTPISDAEKVVVAWTKLVQQLAAINDDRERKLYVKRIAKLLNQDIVEAARDAFAKF